MQYQHPRFHDALEKDQDQYKRADSDAPTHFIAKEQGGDGLFKAKGSFLPHRQMELFM